MAPPTDQSFTGPTCRQRTLPFALRTCKYFEAVDLFILSRSATSLIELLGLSPRDWTIRCSISSNATGRILDAALTSDNATRRQSTFPLIISRMLLGNHCQGHLRVKVS